MSKHGVPACINGRRNPEYTKAQNEAYYLAHKEQIDAYSEELRWKRKCQAVDILGGICIGCGNSDARVLQFDHINGNGNKHRQEIGLSGGSASSRWVLNNPEEAKSTLQLLCANCHALKTGYGVNY